MSSDPQPPSAPDGRFHEHGGDMSFLPEGGLPGDARLYAPGDGAWPGDVVPPLTADPLPVRRLHKPVVVLGAVALVAVVVSALASWLLRPSPATTSSPTTNPASSTTSVSPSPDAAAQARLMRLLPTGYPAGSCKPAAAPKGALAEANCDKNSDPGGPVSATYTLVRDKGALDAALNTVVQASTTVICPGNIQSPGPWRRNATPEKISGGLYCGIQEGRPMVAWTDDAKLLLSAVQAGPEGPTLPQLYAWWSSHS